MLRAVTTSIFPEAEHLPERKQNLPFFSASREIESSLVLQMLLYFNVYYSFIWFITQLTVFIWKVKLNQESPNFTAVAFAVWALAEPFRLGLGYSGNLKEKVPHLTAFFLLTVLPQTAILIYMVASHRNTIPFEYAASFIMIIFFLLPQIIEGYRITRKIIRLQTQRFYLQIANEHMYENNDGIDNEAL